MFAESVEIYQRCVNILKALVSVPLWMYFFFTGSLRNADLMSDSENISALATPSRTQRRMDPRRRRLKLFRKKTFLVNDANKSNENGTTLGSSDGNDNDNGSSDGSDKYPEVTNRIIG